MQELLDRTAQLERVERDIRQRAEARLARKDAVGRDLVQERLAWLLARASAQRRTADSQLAVLVPT